MKTRKARMARKKSMARKSQRHVRHEGTRGTSFSILGLGELRI